MQAKQLSGLRFLSVRWPRCGFTGMGLLIQSSGAGWFTGLRTSMPGSWRTGIGLHRSIRSKPFEGRVMSKAKKRRPDFRRIRPSKTYTLPEIASSLDRSIATVRGWIRDGLPTLDDDAPPLVIGADLKSWLQTKWSARKHKCSPGELYCCACRRPRKTRPGSVAVVSRNAKTSSITARCEGCGTRMTQSLLTCHTGADCCRQAPAITASATPIRV